ncbi:hypothetical protein [Oryza sativa Japonica Group]|uniref:Uncharacterized protein n=1 Tax=Oryza sativa subsp. japonica TaxID=39947 RepID=Q5JL90_ORYSJ|nr:hypothetical protein [Oryza sativa Japonica Group]
MAERQRGHDGAREARRGAGAREGVAWERDAARRRGSVAQCDVDRTRRGVESSEGAAKKLRTPAPVVVVVAHDLASATAATIVTRNHNL